MADPRVTVLTGGAGGIAMASARRLHDCGPVLLADLPGDRLESAAEQLRSAGAARVETLGCDISDAEQVAALADATAALGRFGALVHTAGLAPPMATDPGAVVRVDLTGTASVVDAFEPLAEAGSVAVLIASLAGHRALGVPHDDLLLDPYREDVFTALDDRVHLGGSAMAAYTLAKRGNIQLARQRARQWGARGARIVSVSPGLVADTTIGQAALRIVSSYADQSALKRAGTADDIAGVVAFLVSDDAKFVTGTDILVDGGVVAQMLFHEDADVRDSWNRAGLPE